MLLHGGHNTAQKFFTPANAASYDAVARYATFGKDKAWKRRIVGKVRSCYSILELASGTGILSSMLVSSGKSVMGLDLSFDYLIASKGKIDLRVAQATAEALPYKGGQFDAVVSSYLTKYVDIMTVAQECMHILRHGGIVVFHDFTYPTSPAMRIIWKSYFRILRFCGIFAPSWSLVFNRLDSFIENSKWESKTIEALAQSGFRGIRIEYLTAGTAAIIAAEKP
ncbi:MAG: class I SAM-dependent methyltransferase [Nitrososphaera sp.]